MKEKLLSVVWRWTIYKQPEDLLRGKLSAATVINQYRDTTGAILTSDHDLSDEQVNKARQKLMVTFSGTQQIDMSWWRMYMDNNKVRRGEGNHPFTE